MGLVQRAIESAGFSTMTLSTVPALTASVGVPRLAAIERPFGMNVGNPGDHAGQLAVVRATLQALVQIESAGGVVNLPYGCDQSRDSLDLDPPEPPPISKYLMRHPWALPRFVKRDPPTRA